MPLQCRAGGGLLGDHRAVPQRHACHLQGTHNSFAICDCHNHGVSSQDERFLSSCPSMGPFSHCIRQQGGWTCVHPLMIWPQLQVLIRPEEDPRGPETPGPTTVRAAQPRGAASAASRRPPRPTTAAAFGGTRGARAAAAAPPPPAPVLRTRRATSERPHYTASVTGKRSRSASPHLSTSLCHCITAHLAPLGVAETAGSGSPTTTAHATSKQRQYFRPIVLQFGLCL